MPTIEAIAGASDPIKMCFFEPPAGAQGSREIYQRGVATAREGIVVDGIPQAPKSETISVLTAKAHSFGFAEVYGRKAGTSTVVACMSTWLAGFDGTDPQKQRECGEAILEAITGPNVEVRRYGEHKRVAFLRTRWDAPTMVRGVLDAQDDLIGIYFPRYAKAQDNLTKERYSRLVEKKPFDDIFNGEVSALKKPIEDDSDNPDSNNNYYFTWGYQQEGNELVAISPDNIKYSMAMLIATSPLKETALMIQDINNFMQGDDDETRVVVQIDWGEDASCSNTAINAQQNISIPGIGTFNLSIREFGSENMLSSRLSTSGTVETLAFYHLYHKNETNSSQNLCQKCKKSKDENACNCNKDKTSDHIT